MSRSNRPVCGPLLRWAGSKRKLLSRLIPIWEQSGGARYVEPFVGSGALFFAASPKDAVLSDSNGDLISLYRTVRRQPRAVAAALIHLKRNEKTFLHLRRQSSTELTAVHRAARFIFLNRLCFNGLYRTNKNGQFNVPFAPAKTGRMPDLSHLRRAANLLRKAKLYSGDFESIVEREVRPGDFIYLDPPYAVANRRIFRQYSATTFGFDDLQRVADLLYAIEAVGAHFVLSYAFCAEALQAFRYWPQTRVLIHRNIAGFVAKRRRSTELIVTNIAYPLGLGVSRMTSK